MEARRDEVHVAGRALGSAREDDAAVRGEGDGPADRVRAGAGRPVEDLSTGSPRETRERRVEAAVLVQAGDADPAPGPGGRRGAADDDDLAVALHDQAEDLVEGSAAVGGEAEGELAVARERRVERSVRQQARDRAVAVGDAADEDPASGVDRDSESLLLAVAESQRQLAVAAERGIERAAGCQAGHREVEAEGRAADVGGTDRDDTAVRLAREGVRVVLPGVADVETDHSVAALAESGIGIALGRHPRDEPLLVGDRSALVVEVVEVQESAVRVGGDVADLEGPGVDVVEQPVLPERRDQAAARVEPRDRPAVAAGQLDRLVHQVDAAVRSGRHAAPGESGVSFGGRVTVDRGDAVAAERGVECAARRQPHGDHAL